jgi:hypothetical protein
LVTYVLRGIIGSTATLHPCRALTHAVVVPLAQGLHLLPMTGDLFDEVRGESRVDRCFVRCQLFPPGFEWTLADWSRIGPAAYVEADYFGGTGSQFAAVWRAGDLVLGPIFKPEDAPPPGPGNSPISQALRALGASADGHFDEFDAVGLGRHRRTEDWFTHTP